MSKKKSNDNSAVASPSAPTKGKTSAFFWGAASGIAVMLAAPLLRPAAKSAVKTGIKLSRQAQQVGATLKEEFEDITAEAKAELDQEESAATPSDGHERSHGHHHDHGEEKA